MFVSIFEMGVRRLPKRWVAFFGFLMMGNLPAPQAQPGFEPLWIADGPGFDNINQVLPLTSGQMWISGSFSDSLSLNGQTWRSRGGRDGFVARSDEEGRIVETILLHSPADIRLEHVAWDSTLGRLALLGEYSGQLELPDTTLNSPFGTTSLFVYVVASDAPSWAVSLDCRGLIGAGQLHWSEPGLLWVNGFFKDSLGIGEERLDGKGETDAFLLEFSDPGQLERRFSFGGSGNTRARLLNQNAKGELILSGVLDGELDLPDTSLAAVIPGDYDLFLFAFDPLTESESWAIWGGEVLDEEVTALLLKEDGSILLGGFFAGILRFESGLRLESTSIQPDAFLLKIDEAGRQVSGIAFGGPGNVRLLDLTRRGEELLGAGAFTETLSFPPFEIRATGVQSGYVMRLNENLLEPTTLNAVTADQTVFLEAAAYLGSTPLVGGQFSGKLFNQLPSNNQSLDGLLLQPSVPTSLYEAAKGFFLLRVYPNPTKGAFYLDQKVDCDSFSLIGPGGKLLEAGLVRKPASWDISDYPKGMYLLHLRCEGSSRTLRVLKE
jgi:hypothetical protein